jgi:hypothetical protein
MSFLSNILGGKKEENKKLIIQDANSYLDKIKATKSIPVINSNLMLDKGESAFWEEPSKMYETRTVRKSSGGYAGVRLMKGLSVGGYSGSSEGTQEWREIDQGRLTLTNKRIVFDGNKENRIIQINKIIGVNVFLGSVRISGVGKTKDTEFSTKNPYILGALINLVNKTENPLDLSGVNIDIQFQ